MSTKTHSYNYLCMREKIRTLETKEMYNEILKEYITEKKYYRVAEESLGKS